MYERYIDMQSVVAETERQQFVVRRISEGFGIGEGGISAADASIETLIKVDETIETNPDILVPVGKDDTGQSIEDDGCGDGRGTVFIIGLGRVLKRGLNRAKVFGGSVAMAAAARIGLGEATGQRLNVVFDQSIDQLQACNMDFGAHSDEHAQGPNCGCGAIDRAPDAIHAAVVFETEIRGIISALGVDDAGLDKVYGNFREYAQQMDDQPPYSGRRVLERILSLGKVVKTLVGPHRERRIVLNNLRGYTVNQQLIRDVTGDQAQIFGVDIWRMQDIADRLHDGQSERQHQALLSELIYTLAVAAVLTKGDLPVYMIQPAEALQAA